jgi:hypothetical protein
VAKVVTTLLAAKRDFLASLDPFQFADHAAAVKPLKEQQQFAHVVDDWLRQVERRRFHAHHASARDVDRQRRDVVEMRVRHEPGRRSHEIPGLSAQIEAQLQLRDAPVTLNRGARIALDRQPTMMVSQERSVVHRSVHF